MKLANYTPHSRIYRILTLSILMFGLISQGTAFGSLMTARRISRGPAKAFAVNSDAVVREWSRSAFRYPFAPSISATRQWRSTVRCSRR